MSTMPHDGSGLSDAVAFYGGPAFSFSGALYAVVTDTFWIGAATFLATAAGIAINGYKVYRESKDRSIDAVIANAKKELEDARESSRLALQEAIAEVRRSYEMAIKIIEESHAVEVRQMADSQDRIEASLNAFVESQQE